MPYEASVGPAVQPSVDVPLAVTPQALGAGVGDAVQNLGEVATDIHLKEIDHANRTNVLDADNQQQAFIQARMHDPKTGILNQPLGKDAPAAVDQALSEFDQSAARVEAGLTNENQKAHFRQMATERRLQMADQLGRYEHSEVQRWERDVATAGVDNAINAAALNADDPLAVFDNVDLIKGIIDHQGQIDGLPAEKIAELQTKAASKAYVGVIGSLVDQDDTAGAQAAFDQWGGELTADDRSTARGWLKVSHTANESRAIADEVIHQAPTLSQALDDLEARNIKDTAVYDKAKARIIADYQQRRQAEDQDQADLFDNATLMVDQGQDVPATTLATLKPRYKRELMNYQAQKARGVPVATPFDVQYGLDQAIASDPVSFSQLDLRLLKGTVSDQDLDRYSKAQAEIKKGSNTLSAELGSRQETLTRHMTEAGLVPAKAGKRMGDDEREFRSQFQKALDAEQKRTGKEATADQVAAIADRLLAPVVLARPRTNPIARFFDEVDEDAFKHAFQVPGAARPVSAIALMPPDAVVISRKALIKAGISAPSDDAIVAHYNESLVEAYRDAR